DPHVVVVSDGFWRTRLQRDPAIVGRAIIINGEPYVVTGVLPAGFKSISGFGLVPEIYLPLSPRVFPSLSRPRSAAAQLVGRLRPDQTVAEGRAALSVVITRIAQTDGRPEFESLTEFAAVGGVSQVREFREL